MKCYAYLGNSNGNGRKWRTVTLHFESDPSKDIAKFLSGGDAWTYAQRLAKQVCDNEWTTYPVPHKIEVR